MSAGIQVDAPGEEVSVVKDMKTYVVPNLTIKDLLDAIPAHCFKRSALKSSLYVMQDLTLLTLLTLAHNALLPHISSLPLSWAPKLALQVAAWNAYWFAMGLVATGVWVIAHECGHQAFSESKVVNNTVGFILHSALGVPYHSWRISHARHHASTGHMTRDQVFVPPTRSAVGLPKFDENREDREGRWVAESVRKELREAMDESPLVQFGRVLLQQVFGWPLYLLLNVSGQPSYPRGTNHFSPRSVVFEKRHFAQIVQSDIGIVAWLAALAAWGYTRGFTEVALYYLPTYLWVNHWLVLITFLQHTDPLLPHYRAGTWTFPRGALATIDRRLLGPVGGWVLHGISETHTAHHVASKMPHYGAWEATAALKARLGNLYMESDENAFAALWRVYNQCRFVEDEGDVVFWKNREGKAGCVGVFQEKEGAISDSGVELR